MEDPSTEHASMMDDALALLDHLSARMTASALTGLGCGAIYSTHKGFPIAKTSLSAAASCALISTACFAAERLAYGLLHQTLGKDLTTSPNLLYGSHAIGGIWGGGVVGFLYQGNPFRGMLLLTPIMLGVGMLEISLNDYRASRMQQLKLSEIEDSNR
ncbi:hypothetical protein ACHAXN_002133 [Cyclotella atomus]|jgi:hypothetical protein